MTFPNLPVMFFVHFLVSFYKVILHLAKNKMPLLLVGCIIIQVMDNHMMFSAKCFS